MTAKSDVLVKLVLVFFISLLSFSIGTFVGKKYSDNQHRLASLEPASAAAREVASADASHGGHGVSDEDIAKLAEEFAMEEDSISEQMNTVAQNDHKVEAHEPAAHGHGHAAPAHPAEKGDHKPASTHAAPAHTAPAAPAATKPAPQAATKVDAHTEPQDVAKKFVAGQTTASMVKAAQQETRVPSSLPKDVAQYSVGKFTVQIASFKSEDDARKKAEDLKSRGYGAFYFPANVKGETWYRVGVGLFPTEDDAKNYRREFSTKNNITDAVIQKIVN